MDAINVGVNVGSRKTPSAVHGKNVNSNENAKPNASQVRTEVWMSLIHGSSGLIYFVHQFSPKFVEASLLQDADLLAGVTAINKQIQSLAPALNSPTISDGVSFRPSPPTLPSTPWRNARAIPLGFSRSRCATRPRRRRS